MTIYIDEAVNKWTKGRKFALFAAFCPSDDQASITTPHINIVFTNLLPTHRICSRMLTLPTPFQTKPCAAPFRPTTVPRMIHPYDQFKQWLYDQLLSSSHLTPFFDKNDLNLVTIAEQKNNNSPNTTHAHTCTTYNIKPNNVYSLLSRPHSFIVKDENRTQ